VIVDRIFFSDISGPNLDRDKGDERDPCPIPFIPFIPVQKLACQSLGGLGLPVSFSGIKFAV
jgi:hypothetical protein